MNSTKRLESYLDYLREDAKSKTAADRLKAYLSHLNADMTDAQRTERELIDQL